MRVEGKERDGESIMVSACCNIEIFIIEMR